MLAILINSGVFKLLFSCLLSWSKFSKKWGRWRRWKKRLSCLLCNNTLNQWLTWLNWFCEFFDWRRWLFDNSKYIWVRNIILWCFLSLLPWSLKFSGSISFELLEKTRGFRCRELSLGIFFQFFKIYFWWSWSSSNYWRSLNQWSYWLWWNFYWCWSFRFWRNCIFHFFLHLI